MRHFIQHSPRPASPTTLGASADAKRVFRYPDSFSLLRGGILPGFEIAYETWGELSPRRDNAVLIFPGLSPNTHAASSEKNPQSGWWEYMIGPDKPIDTNQYFVICINSLGSCHGSTGPSSVNPTTGQKYALDFPDLSLEDIAASARELLRAMDLTQLHSVVGVSLGGMVSLYYATQYAAEVKHLISISAAVSAKPFAIAIRSLQREIVRNDPNWNGGNYTALNAPLVGMRTARKLGLLSYRSAGEWDHRFGRKRIVDSTTIEQPFRMEYEVETYLEHNAAKFQDAFDANAYLYLTRAMDRFDLSAYGPDLVDVFKKLRTEQVLIIGVTSDFLFPIDQQKEIAEAIQQADKTVQMVELASTQGHDSFLVDKERFAPTIRDFFSGLHT